MNSESIRILHIIQKMHSGGVEQRKLLLAQRLPKDKFIQKIICTEAHPELREKFTAVGCEVIEVGPLRHPFDWRVHSKVLKAIKSFNPDIVHGSVFEGNTMAALDGYLSGVPTRILEETSYPTQRSYKAKLLFRTLAYLAHKVIAISPAVQSYLIQSGVPSNQIELIMNGVKDPIELSTQEKIDLRKRLNINPKDIVIGSVGRMENDVKGFDKLILYYSKIICRIPESKLLIIGGGKLLPQYKRLAKKFNLHKNIIFAGFQDNVNDYYEIMDVYISLPRNEGFGLSIVEAMSHKIPVLASNVGGIANIIEHGTNGYFIISEEDVATIIDNLLEDNSLYVKISENAYNTYKTKFSAHIYIKNVQEHYLSSL